MAVLEYEPAFRAPRLPGPAVPCLTGSRQAVGRPTHDPGQQLPSRPPRIPRWAEAKTGRHHPFDLGDILIGDQRRDEADVTADLATVLDDDFRVADGAADSSFTLNGK